MKAVVENFEQSQELDIVKLKLDNAILIQTDQEKNKVRFNQVCLFCKKKIATTQNIQILQNKTYLFDFIKVCWLRKKKIKEI